MTNHYDRYLIDELETLVDKYRRSKVDLRLIDEALSKRKPKNRNLALRDKIAELLKVEPQSNKQSSAQTTSTGHIGDDMDKTPAVEYPEGFMKEAFVDMRKKLLDISGSRSRLINLDQTRKGVVRFVDELPDQLARTLLDDKAMTVVPIPEPTKELLIEHSYIEWDEADKRYKRLKKDPDAKEWAGVLGIMNSYELPLGSDHTDDDRHTDLDLQSMMFEPALNSSLKKLASEARISIDETGNNILFLSLGFLEWCDQTDSSRKRLAPLYMIPVRIEKKAVKGVAVYKLRYTGEDIIPNLTLREKLKLEFDLVLPHIVDQDNIERLLLPEEYFKEISALIARKSGDPAVKQWKVRRFGTLATLSLGKLLMYLDLDPEKWPAGDENLLQHDVIKRFFQDEIHEPVSNGSMDNAYVLDDVPDLHHQFPMIDDADSSQMSVVIDALKGQSLVVEGPPGTGKSQTITNLIAAGLSQGKSVLFVAEKQAALDVVKRRMDKAGLGDFCLDLHSDKAQKRLVLDSFNERKLNQPGYEHSLNEYDIQVSRFERARKQLQEYAAMVNEPWRSTGMTIHEVLSAATRYAKEVDPLKYKDIAPGDIRGVNFNQVALDEQLEQLEVFYTYLGQVVRQLDDRDNWSSHPWQGVTNKQLTSLGSDAIIDYLKHWNEKLEQFISQFHVTCKQYAINIDHDIELSDAEALTVELTKIPQLDGSEILSAVKNIQENDLAPLKDAIKGYESIGRGYQKLKQVFVKDLMSDLSKSDKLEAGLQTLGALGVPQHVDLNALVQAVGLLEQTLELYRNINIKRTEMLPHVPAEVRSLLGASESGFTELGVFVSNASSIPATFLKYREDVFENPDFPDVFVEIEKALNSLLSERDALAKDFNLESLPDNEALAHHAKLLSETNAFSWVNTTWRATKKAVLAITKAEKIEYREFAKRVEALLAWKKACEEFETSSKYAEALGTQFDGLKTDLERVARLKDWYVSVRQEYGVGFGQRVPLARALYTLPVDMLQGVQGLAEGGLTASISSFVENLKRLSEVFTKPACFSDSSVTFDQEVNPLNSVLFEIRSSLSACQGFLVDPSISQSQLMLGVSDLKQLKASIAEVEKADINGRYFNSVLNLTINDSCEFHSDLLRVVSTYKFVANLHNSIRSPQLADLVKNASDKTALDSIRESGSKLASSSQAAKSAEQAFLAEAQAVRSDWFSYSGEQLNKVIERNSKAINNEVWLDGWLKYLFARERMEQGGFGKLKQYLCEGEYTLEHAQHVMKFATYQCLAHEIYREMPVLGERSGHEQTALQQQFAKYDEKLKELQRKRVAALCAKREAPVGISGARVSSYTDDVLLNNEIKKKTKHISIRNLVLRAGNAMQAYKPCFMMSPMAVAKYIPPGSLKFDLVIMDEASQVKPEYALSSFARGKQVIVVGDPKQLPPTSFFERALSNDDLWEDEKESSVVEDAESILDAVDSQFPSRQLRWHYRSRHESLIDFSNHNFYDSNLVVFPSPWNDSPEFGIKFHYVDNARFLKSVNVTESQTVVNSIKSHLLENPSESLGIVAMNVKQKEQIEADLELALAEDKLLLTAYERNLKSIDPLFIKNLENVQGDERDVIYISFTYGPQEKGSVSIPQRFGPINGATGWRRLNVLFTRAKKRINVFSSMTANQVVVNETSSRGVRALREYLEYAQSGRLVQQAGVKQREPDSDFEIAVIKALNSEGFECVPQVGVAGFYIDIAVKDPGMPGRYLMGVECDGASYHSTKSTRDRDRVRQSVLEGLGWNIKRIWSTDWFKNPKAELKPIIDELKDLSTPISDFVAEKDSGSEEEENLGVVDAESYLADVAQSLDERLVNFAMNVIQREFPDTPMESRLLRPDMLDRLIKDKPVNREDFSIFIPKYLRENTCPKEAVQFLDDVLEIIADFEENEVA